MEGNKLLSILKYCSMKYCKEKNPVVKSGN